MNNYTKTVVSAVQTWTADQIKQSKPDWNQNDPSGMGYIKNRTHYEKLETKFLVDNLTREDYENRNYPRLTFVVGNLYTVIWNGITYSDLECWYDGEYRILGDPNQLPFYIDDNGGNNLYISAANDDDNYTVSIIGVISDIKTIDPKFLPDGIGYDTREEKIIFSAPLENRNSIYDLTKLSNIIEDIYNATHISVNFPEYDFSLEKTIINIVYDPSSRPHLYCPEIDDVICVYLENQTMADDYFDEYYRNNDDELNPLTPGLYIFDAPQRLSFTLWELSGELHTIDPKYLPDFRSDWNEISPDSPKYINNKPFGESLSSIIENLTYEDYFNNNFEAPTFIVGETYTVVWNGETYSNLICWEDQGNHVIGNEPGGPTLPFWIDDNGGNNGLDIDWMEEFENVTIYQEGGEIKQIDEKFLPILSKQESNNILIDNQIIEAFNNKQVEFNEDLAFEINPEAKYTIIFNDVEYTDLIPWYDEDICIIGSEDVWNGYSDSETPFASDGTQFITNDDYDSYKLTIIEHNLVNKIDPKYLPDNGNNNNNNGNGNGNTSGGVSSWNDLTDKPFYPPNIYYEWNEDTTYETKVAMPEGDPYGYLAKISDDSPSSDFFIGKYMTAAINNNGKTQIQAVPITSNIIISGDGYYGLGNAVFIISADSIDIGGITLTKGIWCPDDWDESQSNGISFLYIQIHDEGKTLDESVIPNTIARASDLEHYTYGTEDLTAGVSELATGMLYFVYE